MNSPGKNTGVGSHSLLQGIFQPRNHTCVSCITGGFFTSEPPEKPINKPDTGKYHKYSLICEI